MDRHFRTLRIVHAAMLVAALLYTAVPEFLKLGTRETFDRTFYLMVAVMAALSAGALFPVREAMVVRGWQALEAAPDDASALMRWFKGNIVLFALCESIVLYGMVLRFVGATLTHVMPFYVAGILLFLLFAPRKS